MNRAGPRRPGPVLVACALAGFLLLLAPAVVVAAVSFSSGDFLAFPPPGLSLRWYAALLDPAQSAPIHTAARNSC